METIRKQAAKLREQVAKQQQALLKHLGHFSAETIIVDEAEFNCYKNLHNLHKSTRDAKHFQKHIVRGVEGYIAANTKQTEIARKLANDSCKYAAENQYAPFPLSSAALQLGNSYNLMELERETLMGTLIKDVTEPLRGLISGAPLEDARHLTQRYDKLRQEIEAQMSDILKKRAKTKESEITPESCAKLKASETRLQELKSTLFSLGKEATSAMATVEDQQQQITFQRLSAMVDAERCYHRNVLAILEKLHYEMNLELQRNESLTKPLSKLEEKASKEALYVGKVVHPFDAQAEGELNLEIDDYIVVRKVETTGWSEGENGGKVGWFPSAYVERVERAPATKFVESTASLT